MKISKIHQEFSERLNEQKVLTNPEEFLGPNWKEVLDFWLYIDTLSGVEREKIIKSYVALDHAVAKSARYASWNSAREVDGDEVRNASWWAALDVSNFSISRDVTSVFRDATIELFAHATMELIAHHKLLEQRKSLVFLPFCLNP